MDICPAERLALVEGLEAVFQPTCRSREPCGPLKKENDAPGVR
jgi:hypothetical protein